MSRVDELCREIAEAMLECPEYAHACGEVTTDEQERICAWLTVAIRQAVEHETVAAVQTARPAVEASEP